MSKFRLITCCATLLCSFCGCATRPVPVNRAEDERAIRDLEAEASEALAARDLDHLASLYAKNAALYYADNPVVAGSGAIRETWKAILARPGFAMRTAPLNVEISASGDLGFARGSYSMTVNDAKGMPVTGTGEYALVYGKQPDGKWKIIADNGSAELRAHALPQSPDRRQQPASQLGPLIGLAGLFCVLGFLFGAPVVAASAWKYFRSGKLPTGLPVAIAMVLVFWIAATQLWRYVAAHYWNMSFMTAVRAAGDSARFGHPIEHTAEVLVIDTVIFSTLLALAAGAITFAVRRLWLRHSRRIA